MTVADHSAARASEHDRLAIGKYESLAPLSMMSFAETCLFRPEQIEMALSASSNYKMYVHVGIQSPIMTQVKLLINTSAGFGLISESCLLLLGHRTLSAETS